MLALYVHTTAADGTEQATPYTVWTTPGTEATYPPLVDPYYERQDTM